MDVGILKLLLSQTHSVSSVIGRLHIADPRRSFLFLVLQPRNVGHGGDCKTVVAYAGGRRAWWSNTKCLGVWFSEGSGEIIVV
jgi:hypothetical protein